MNNVKSIVAVLVIGIGTLIVCGIAVGHGAKQVVQSQQVQSVDALYSQLSK